MPRRRVPEKELHRVRRLPAPRPSSLPLSAKQRLYIRLMAQGMNNVAACRVVGVSRKTGTRWRLGRTRVLNGRVHTYGSITGAAPRGVPRAVSARFLSEGERLVIADGRLAGQSLRCIAAELGRSPSTISREVTSNADPVTGRYRPHGAQRQSEDRRATKGTVAVVAGLRTSAGRSGLSSPLGRPSRRWSIAGHAEQSNWVATDQQPRSVVDAVRERAIDDDCREVVGRRTQSPRRPSGRRPN
jgi:Helix-turn-helix domain